jgi:hypothetical protein
MKKTKLFLVRIASKIPFLSILAAMYIVAHSESVLAKSTPGTK